jgi:phospholipid/cholesterol/gamma-HCH transport system substrate-binding protein
MTGNRRGVVTQARVGVFVLLGVLVFLGLVYLLGAQARLFEPQHTLYTEFTSVGGLLEGATVRLAGVQIGRVTRVSLPGEPGGKVRVELRIARRYADRIRQDSVARLDTQGLLGDKVIEITVGSAAEPALAGGALLASREAADIGQVLGQSAEVVLNMSALAASLRQTAEALNTSGLVRDLAATAASARRIGEQIEQGRGLAHALVYEEPLVLRRLDRLLASTQALLERAERGDGMVGVLTAKQSGDAARRFVAAMDRVARALDGGSGSDGMVAALLFDPKYRGVAEDLRVLTRNLRDVSERLAGGRGTLGVLLRDDGGGDELRPIAADLRAAVSNLRAVAEKLNSTEGTLGALIADPSVYENLAAVLEGSQRSLLLRTLIKGLGAQGREAKAREK